MPTIVSNPNPNLAATEIVSQQAELATQMGTYWSPAAVPEGNISGTPKSEVSSIPTSLSQPRVQVPYALLIREFDHGS